MSHEERATEATATRDTLHNMKPTTITAVTLPTLALSLALCACSGDRTITHGADGANEWDRKLHAAVAVGTPVEDVVMLMQKNGFTCEGLAEGSATLTCQKESSGAVTRHWQASFDVTDGKVAGIHSDTGIQH
jgi:hypothetical protein